MSLQLKLLDHFKLKNQLAINFACSYSEDNRFFILNDVGIYILAFTGALSNELPKFLSTKHFIHLSNFTPCGNVELDLNSFHNQLPKEEVFNLVMKVEYSANLNHTKPIEPAPIYAEWSPKGLANKHDCYLAALTNMYSLEIYMKYLNDIEEVQYVAIANLTSAIICCEKSNWSIASRLGLVMKLEEYKRRIDCVTPSAFTWSHLLQFNNTKSAVIFCGHLNGDISLWRLNAIYFEIGKMAIPIFLGRYHTQLKRVATMYWHQSSEYGGGLFVSDVDGKLNIVHITNLNDDKAVFKTEKIFLTESDKIKIDKVSVLIYNNFTFIIVIKQRVLIIYGLNKDGELFDSTSEYIQEYYITGLHHFDNKILVLSLPGIITELSIEVKNKKIILEKSPISLKYDMVKYRTHGFFFSKNMILCFILAYPWDLQSFYKTKNDVHIFVYHNIVLKPFELLWNNEKDSIVDYWDCFEVLRMICIKEKRFPWLGLPSNVNYGTLSLTKLKTLRLVAKLSEMLFIIVPSIKKYEMKPFILVHYLLEIRLVVERITRLLKQRKNKELTIFQMRSIFIQNFFLKEMVAKNILPKANVGKGFIESIRSVMEIANELEYPEPLTCAWCGEKIFGPTCFPPHYDSRCCISMMPIFIVPEYKCLYCKSMIHKSIEEEMHPIVCPYCDKLMDKLHLKDDKLKESCEQFETVLPKLKYSDCFKDCLKETISYEDIEDNNVEYVIFSDSDDEPETIKILYEQFSKSNISEEVKQEIIEDEES